MIDIPDWHKGIIDQRLAEKELERSHSEFKAINEILLRVTREKDLNGISFLLQDIMKDFYPGCEILFFLLNPNREGFYFPLPGKTGETCFEEARNRIAELNLEYDLLRYLAGNGVKLSCCSEEKSQECPPVIKRLAKGYQTWIEVPIGLEDICYGLFMVGSATARFQAGEGLIFVETLIRQISGVIRYQIAKDAKEEALKRQLTGPDKYMGIVGRSPPIQEVYRMIRAVADSPSTVLITGESGTGKELVARAIHRTGRYRDTPFIAAHCSSFVPTLVHSEIFGHEKGAFTGATSRKRGRLERAEGGILFLDEVADLPMETQVLLLRFLQDKSFERVGGERPVQVNVRVIAATNKDIEKEMKAGRVREDFYYRLNVIQIKLPPLRERITDVVLLANHFLRTYCLIEGKEIKGFDTKVMKSMMDYPWPGNVRELQNTIAKCIVLASGEYIDVDLLPKRMRSLMSSERGFSLAENEKQLILNVMREAKWNKHEAARLLSISRSTLYSKLRRYKIQADLK